MTTAAWIYWIAGAALGGIGFYLASWALLSDWLAGHRKQRRCAKCWYDMAATAGMKCPECGREAKSEKGLHRSRRRWRGAALGLCLMVVGVLAQLASWGALRGWYAVLPVRLQIALVPWIGSDPIFTSAIIGRVRGASLGDAQFAAIEALTIRVLEDSKTEPWRKENVLRGFYGLKKDPIDRERFGAAATAVILSSTSDIPRSEAIVWAGNLRGPTKFAQEVIATLGPQRTSSLLSKVFEVLCRPPVDQERVLAIADASQRMTSRMGFGEIYPIMNAHPEAFFGRIAENLRNAKEEDLPKVLSPMYSFLRSSTVQVPARDEIVQRAAELLGRSDPELRSVCRDVTDPTHGEKLLPALPALVSHLSSQVGESRTWAKRVLTRIQLSEGSNKILLELLANRFCEQDPQGRLDALEVFRARVPTPLTLLRADVFACLETINDAAALDAALAAFFPDEATGIVWQPESQGPANPELRALLARMLRQPGARTIAAARWLGERGDAMTELRATLAAVASDASRHPADRAAARDALLHIRDRESPITDPLLPITPNAPPR